MYNEGNKRIEFTYNKRAGSINGVNVTFFFPMLIRQNNAYISELDFQKILEPSLKGKVYRKHQLKNIMLDPGHGGSDPGACGLNKNEETVNLEVALKLKKALTNLGFNVIMTRSSDKTVSLQDRAAHCQKVKPDLYISLHCNSAENKSVSGIETF